MSDQAPNNCPFCGAASQQSTMDKEDIQYRCGSWVNHGGPNSTTPPMSPIRTMPCFEAERERLTRERDDWKRVAEGLNAFMERARSKTDNTRESLECLREFDALQGQGS